MIPLRPYQQQVVRAVLNSIVHRRGLSFTVLIARQGGKNELSAQLELSLLLAARSIGGEQVKCAPTFDPQCRISLRRLWGLCQSSGLDHVRHGATISGWNAVKVGHASQRFLSAEPSASVVGHTVSRLLECDEAQDVAADKFDKDFRPMAATTNATTVYYGTAWDETCLLAQMVDRHLELERQDGLRRHFAFDWQTVAAHNPAYRTFVEAERDRLGEDHPLFQTQYLLRTLAGSGRLFTPQALSLLHGTHQAQAGPTNLDRSIVAGLDVGGEQLQQSGRDPDRTVLTIARVTRPVLQPSATGHSDPTIDVLAVYSWQGEGQPALIPALLALLARWRVRRLTVDATGIGEGLGAALDNHARGCAVSRLRLSERSKSDLGFQLQAAAGSGRVHYPDGATPEVAEALRQCRLAYATYRPNRSLAWGVRESDGHDDHLLSLALAVESAREGIPASRGRTAVNGGWAA